MEGDTGKSWRQIFKQPLNEKRMDTYERLMEAEARLDHVRRRRGLAETAIVDVLDEVESGSPETEREDDLYLNAISRYVAELGGHVEVRAVFEEEAITLLTSPDEPRG